MRQFGMISTSIWRSVRFRNLTTDLARLVYLYTHTSTHGNSAGAYVLPPELAALDLRRDPDEVRAAIEELAEVGLIRYDPAEELIQIVDFFRFNSIKSRKHLAGPMRIITEVLPASPVRKFAAAELVLDIFERAMGWDSKVEARAIFLHEAAELIKKLNLQDIIAGPDLGLSETLLITLSETLLIPLPIQGNDQDHRYDHDHGEDQDHGDGDDHGAQAHASQANSKAALTAPPSSPAGGSRSGRGEVSQETSATIAELNRKVRGGA